MVDMHHDCGPVDSERIELAEDHEIRYWTTRLGCDTEQLFMAVQAVGVNATAVSEYLTALAQPRGARELERGRVSQ